MKRKNLMNDKVIKAMSIGLATMIAVTSTPLNVLAEEVEDEGNTSSGEESHEETASEAAENSVSDAVASDTVVTNDIATNVNAEEVVKVVPNGDSTITVDLSAAVIDKEKATADLTSAEASLEAATAALAIVESYFTDKDSTAKITGSGFTEAVHANLQAYTAAVAVWGVDGPVVPEDMEEGPEKEALKKQKEIFDAVKAVVIDRKWDEWNKKNVVDPAVEATSEIVSEESANAAIEAAFANGTDIARKAADEQKNANTAGEEATTVAKETGDKFDELVGNIETAPTIAAANEAYDELVKVLEDAETSLKEKQKAYDAAVKAYGELKASYESEQAKLVKAQGEFEAASRIYAEAAGKYDDFDKANKDKVSELNNYHSQLKTAQDSYNAAVKSLADAKNKAEALSDAVNAAKKAILEDNASDLEIFDAVTVAKKSATWDNEDAVIKAILKNIVLPKIDGIDESSVKIADKFTKFSDDTCNYLKVTYKVDGKEVTRYFNYVKAGKNSSDIVIFEKRENEIKAKEELNKNADATLYEELGTANMDGFTANGEEVSLSDSSVKMVGTKYYKTSATVTFNPKTEDVELSADGETETKTVTINNNIVASETLILKDADGDGDQDVVQQYTADQTTIIYHKANLAGGGLGEDGYYKFTSEEAARAAMNAELGEGEEIIESTILTKEKYSGTVSSAFAKDFRVVGKTYTYGADGILDRSIDYVDYWDAKPASENDARKEAAALINVKSGETYYDRDTSTEYYVMNASSNASTSSSYKEIDRGLFVIYRGEVTGEVVRNLTVAPLETASAADIKKLIKTKLPKYDGLNNGLGNDEGYVATLKKYLAEGGSLAEDGFLFIRVNEDGTVSYVQGDKTSTTYGYEGTYWNEVSNNTVTTTPIGETVYKDAQLVKGYVTQNKNNIDNNILDQSKKSDLNSDERDLKAAMERGESADALRTKYNRLATEAEQAQADVEEAKAKVNELGDIVNRVRLDNNKQPIKAVNGLNIAGLVADGSMSELTLENLEEFLAKAQDDLDAAKAKVKDLTDQMDEVEAKLAARIAALTPSEEIVFPYGRGGAAGGATPIVVSPTGIPVFPVAAVGAPAAGVAGVRRAAVRANGNGGDEIIESAGTVKPEDKIEEKVVADKKPAEKLKKDTSLTTIQDEEVALAAVPEDVKKQMNWWWLLIVAALGATGYEMYKKHEEKKAAAEGIANSINKESK